MSVGVGEGDYMDMVLCTFSFGYEEVALGTQTWPFKLMEPMFEF